MDLNNSFDEQSEKASQSFIVRKYKGSNWTKEETTAFIELCIKEKIINLMRGNRHRHNNIYKSLEPKLKAMGFIKTGAQMKIKLKHLKEQYYKCKRSNLTSKSNPGNFQYYDEMERLLNGRPTTCAISTAGIDSSSSSIMQEDLSEINGETLDVPLLEPSRLIKKRSGGRPNSIKLADYFAQKHAEKMREVLNEHANFMRETSLEMAENQRQWELTQIENQRQWEREMMEIEHEHQISLFQNVTRELREYGNYSQIQSPDATFPSTDVPPSLSPTSSSLSDVDKKNINT